MQIVGPIYGDFRVLSACYAYESVRPFPVPDMRKVEDFTSSMSKGMQGR
jgi:hypothetical protein